MLNLVLLCRRSRNLTGLFHLCSRMPLKCSGRGKLAELVAHHIFSDIDRKVSLAVVHSESQSNHVGSNCRAPRPGLDYRRTLSTGSCLLNRLRYSLIDEWSLFYRTSHNFSIGLGPICPIGPNLFLLRSSILQDHLLGSLITARLIPTSRLTPWRNWISSTRSFTFAAAVRVVYRVHRDATNLRSQAFPP